MKIGYDEKTILNLLPHRAPLLLAESLQISVSEQSGEGQMQLPFELLWNGEDTHDFYPEMLLEGSAQLGGLLAHALTPESENTQPKHFLVGFPEIRFGNMSQLQPEYPIDVSLRLKARMGGMSRLHFVCQQNEIRFVSGEVTLV